MSDFGLRFLSLLVGAAALLWACVGFLSGVDASAIPWAFALLLTAATPLLAPRCTARGGFASLRLLAWSLAVAAASLSVAMVFVPAPAALALGAIAGLIAALLQLLLALLQWPRAPAEDIAPRIGLAAVFSALCLAPVWLGTAAQLAGSQSGWPARIVALAPGTHLATAIDCDYLRTQWFYAHAPIGGLRFDYPDYLAVLGCYVILVAALFAALRLWIRWPNTSGTVASPC
jgi:hypothetical protein